MKVIIDAPNKKLEELMKKKIIEGVSESGKKEFQLSDGDVGERTYSIDFESMDDLKKYIKEDESLVCSYCGIGHFKEEVINE